MLNTHHTPRFFLWLKKILIPNYNLCKLLTFTQKNRVSKHARAQKLVYITTLNVMDMIYSSTYFF